jgi:ABC-2 type transport system ATP-binding protein
MARSAASPRGSTLVREKADDDAGERYPVWVRGLVKTFGRSRALDEFDLTVVRGEVHGFLGPNGAGKSTTLGALPGLIRTDAGAVRVFGLDPRRDARQR